MIKTIKIIIQITYISYLKNIICHNFATYSYISQFLKTVIQVNLLGFIYTYNQ